MDETRTYYSKWGNPSPDPSSEVLDLGVEVSVEVRKLRKGPWVDGEETDPKGRREQYENKGGTTEGGKV